MGFILPNIAQALGVESPKVFIETGTYLGGVPQLIMDNYQDLYYDKVYTIELGEGQARTAAYRYSLYEANNYINESFDKHTRGQVDSVETYTEFFDGRLTLVNGDSAVYLKEILEKVDQQALIWLDAHSGAQKYARGEEDVPLLSELEAIKQHPINNHIIAIDDAHLFGQKQIRDGEVVCDYSHVPPSVVEAKLREINPNYTIGMARPYGHDMFIAFVR